jgi:hypothetical protein
VVVIVTGMKGKKRERIIRILLNHPQGELSIYRIAKLAECSHVWVIKFLRKLELLNLIKGTRIANAEELFDYWIKINPHPSFKEYHLQEPLKILATTNLTYALTTYYAESFTQNYLFPARVDIYIEDQDQQKWHELLTEQGLVGKGNFRVISDDNHVFYNNRKINKYFNIVSTPQLIFDLLREQGVAAEAAYLLLQREYHDIL